MSKQQNYLDHNQQQPASRWQRTKIALMVITLLVGLLILGSIIVGYKLGWEWTGVGPSVETTITTKGTEVTKTIKEGTS